MCDPITSAVVAGGTSLMQGVMGRNAAKKQAKAQQGNARKEYEQRTAAASDLLKSDAYVGMSGKAGSNLSDLLGLDGGDPSMAFTERADMKNIMDTVTKQTMQAYGANNSLYSGKAGLELQRQLANSMMSYRQNEIGNMNNILVNANNANTNAANIKVGAAGALSDGLNSAASTRTAGTAAMIKGIGGASTALVDVMGTIAGNNAASGTAGAEAATEGTP